MKQPSSPRSPNLNNVNYINDDIVPPINIHIGLAPLNSVRPGTEGTFGSEAVAIGRSRETVRTSAKVSRNNYKKGVQTMDIDPTFPPMNGQLPQSPSPSEKKQHHFRK